MLFYHLDMDARGTDEGLAKLVDLHRVLEARVQELDGSVQNVLEVGAALLEFAQSEEGGFFPILHLLDPAARAELGGEHDQLLDDLRLLEWLTCVMPDSTDVTTLADAITRRMRHHFARDGRLLAQALRMADRSAGRPPDAAA